MGASDWKQRFYDQYVSSGQSGIDPRYSAKPSPRPGLVTRFVTSHIPKDKSSRVIDLGCGYGAILHALSNAGYTNTAGVDASAEQVAMAQSLGLSKVAHGNLSDFLAQTSDASADVVLAIDILEHMMMPELIEVLDEIFRVLKPGGKCIAHVPNAEGIFGMRVRFGDMTHEQAFTKISRTVVLSGRIQQYHLPRGPTAGSRFHEPWAKDHLDCWHASAPGFAISRNRHLARVMLAKTSSCKLTGNSCADKKRWRH